MGNRRLSRKRLYQVEKLGQAIDIGAAAGIANAVKSATQHRQGQEIITEIAIDLGTSKDTIIGCAGGADRAIGKASTVSYVTQLTKARYGTITEIRAVLVEAPAAGNTNIELEHGTAADKEPNQSVGGTKIAQNLTTVGQDESTAYDTHVTLGQNGTAHYLYIVSGNSGVATKFTSGKLLIYIHGFATPDDL